MKKIRKLPPLFKCNGCCKLLLLLLFWGLIFPASYAQDNKAAIKGIVQSEKGEVLQGVSVEIKNDSLNYKSAVVTDNNGSFSVQDLKAGTSYTLSFSYVGYEIHILKNYVLKPGESASVLINLKQSASDLSNVVVVGYGTQKKINVI